MRHLFEGELVLVSGAGSPPLTAVIDAGVEAGVAYGVCMGANFSPVMGASPSVPGAPPDPGTGPDPTITNVCLAEYNIVYENTLYTDTQGAYGVPTAQNPNGTIGPMPVQPPDYGPAASVSPDTTDQLAGDLTDTTDMTDVSDLSDISDSIDADFGDSDIEDC